MKVYPVRQLLIVLCIFECLLVSWWSNIAGPYFSPFLLAGTGITIALLYLKDSRNTPARNTAPTPSPAATKKWIAGAVFLLLSVVLFSRLHHIWGAIPVEEGKNTDSDIIPQIMTLCRRFLRGELPYAPIPFPAYQLYPTYLPLQWLPYCLAELLHHDYRLIPAGGLWFSSGYFLYRYGLRPKDAGWPQLLPALWPLLVWVTLVYEDEYLFGITVESLVAGYYLFTAANIHSRHRMLLALGICLCLFSRYSIIFWVPLCLLCIWLQESFKNVLKIALSILVVFIACYWLPFLSRDADIFLNGYRYHSGAAYGEWVHNNEHGRPVHLFNGFGFASWAFRLLPYADIHDRLAVYQKIHIGACLLTVLLLLLFFLRTRKQLPLNAFLLASLKVYLVVFYAFIQIPYKYLFLVPVMVSAPLLAETWRRKPALQPGTAPVHDVA